VCCCEQEGRRERGERGEGEERKKKEREELRRVLDFVASSPLQWFIAVLVLPLIVFPLACFGARSAPCSATLGGLLGTRDALRIQIEIINA
jgi:hypothetical protein